MKKSFFFKVEEIKKRKTKESRLICGHNQCSALGVGRNLSKWRLGVMKYQNLPRRDVDIEFLFFMKNNCEKWKSNFSLEYVKLFYFEKIFYNKPNNEKLIFKIKIVFH